VSNICEQNQISLIVVNYNAGDALFDCITSVMGRVGEIVIVDNASSDQSIERVEKIFGSDVCVTIIKLPENLGFSKACNIGYKHASGQYLFFLNPDCVVEPDTVQTLCAGLENHPGTGMAGGLLLNPDGTEQAGGRRLVPTPWRSFVKAFGLSFLGTFFPKTFSDFSLHDQPLPSVPVSVEAVSGACMFVKREAIESVGLLDEAYFMHCEDLDWCMRFRENDWQIVFVPKAKVIHAKGTCSRSRPIFVEWNKHKGMTRFYKKFFHDKYPRVLMWPVLFSVWLRFLIVAVYYSCRHVFSMRG